MTLLIGERFLATCPRLGGLLLPLDVIARRGLTRLRLIVLAEDRSQEHRVVTLAHPRLDASDSLRLEFSPFASPEGTSFLIGAFDPASESSVEHDLELLRAAAGSRGPIALTCLGEPDLDRSAGLLLDERTIAAFRVTRPNQHAVRTAYWLDAYWCDANGIYLRGWAHAYEHPLRALRLEAAGRVARLDHFSDRPDLLQFYPEHEHVRHGGFAIYLAAPAGHPVTMTLETEGGQAAIALQLPDGPIPPWPEHPDYTDEVTPTLRHFADLVNQQDGPILQIGARTPHGLEVSPPRHILRGKVIGLDIHPGSYVNVIGDAHGLSSFVRQGSLHAVLSASVLEHLHAPWLLAAEINRVLRLGGLVYHQVPGAWPAHAQPNDFWRFSAEGLRVLFGPASGFEVLEACDSGEAAILPGKLWREKYLDMPTVPTYTMAEIVARKVADIPEGAIAWPLGTGASEVRSRQYPFSGLRPGGTSS